MIASSTWLDSNGTGFGTGGGISGYAHLTNYTVQYQEWGEGPPLVLVPGLAGGVGLLAPLIRELARDFRVISYQLRGEDDCFAVRHRFGIGDLVSDLAEFCNCLCLEKPALLGVSFGGLLALDFAARFPHRLSNLVVQGVGSRFERGLIQRIAGTVLARFPLPSDSPFINQFFNLLFGGPNNPPDLVHFVTRQCWQTDQCVMAHRFQLIERFDLTNRLQHIQVPTLVLSGDRDVLVSPKSLADLANGLPDVQLVRLAGAGHLAFVTDPQRIAQETCDFLAPVAAY